MHNRQDGGLVLNQSRFELFLCKRFTPGLFDHLHIGAVTTGHVHKTIPEVALHSNENGVSGFNRIGKGCFHGGTARAAHRQGQAVVGLPGVAKKLLDFTHQLYIKRIKVADRIARQSLEHRGIGVRRSWTEQQTIGGVDRGNGPAMGRINQPGGVRRRQSQDHQLMASSLRIDRPQKGQNSWFATPLETKPIAKRLALTDVVCGKSRCQVVEGLAQHQAVAWA